MLRAAPVDPPVPLELTTLFIATWDAARPRRRIDAMYRRPWNDPTGTEACNRVHHAHIRPRRRAHA